MIFVEAEQVELLVLNSAYQVWMGQLIRGGRRGAGADGRTRRGCTLRRVPGGPRCSAGAAWPDAASHTGRKGCSSVVLTDGVVITVVKADVELSVRQDPKEVPLDGVTVR